MKKSISGLSHALLSLETLAGVSFLWIFMGLVPLVGSGWDLSGAGLTLGHGQSLPRGLGGEIQMCRAGTASLWLLGCGEQDEGLAGSWVGRVWFVCALHQQVSENGTQTLRELPLCSALLRLCSSCSAELIQVALSTELWEV